MKSKNIIPIILIVILILIMIIGIYTYFLMPSDSFPNSISASQINLAEGTSESTGIIEFGTFSGSVEYDELRIFIWENDTYAGYLEIRDYSGTIPINVTWSKGPDDAIVTYFDYNPNGNEINNGDYLNFSGLSPSTSYSIYIIYKPSGTYISIYGPNNFITKPADSFDRITDWEPIPEEDKDYGIWPAQSDDYYDGKLFCLAGCIAIIVSIAYLVRWIKSDFDDK